MKYTREMFLWQQTYATLFSVSNKLQVLGDKYIDSLTSRQLMAMIAIIHLPKEEASINGIAKKLGTTKQNAKQLVNVLEKKEYVILTPSDRDKRAYNVKITERGQSVLMESSNLGMAFFAEVFKEFSEEELEQFWSYLKKLYHFDGNKQDGFEEPGQL